MPTAPALVRMQGRCLPWPAPWRAFARFGRSGSPTANQPSPGQPRSRLRTALNLSTHPNIDASRRSRLPGAPVRRKKAKTTPCTVESQDRSRAGVVFLMLSYRRHSWARHLARTMVRNCAPGNPEVMAARFRVHCACPGMTEAIVRVSTREARRSSN
jgi:hypothetical protein